MNMNTLQASGKPIEIPYFIIPLAYMTQFKTKKYSDLVIMEANKRHLVYTFRSRNTGKVGIMRRTTIKTSNNGLKYFEVAGKKVFLNKASLVI